MSIGRLFVAVVLAWLSWSAAAGAERVVVGSKRFTEAYLLGEILARTAQAAGEWGVAHQPGLGNTAVLYAALRSGAIDAYPEYTGTLALELLRLPAVPPLAELNERLRPLGLAAGRPFGFANGYALAMRAERAQALGITHLSQLREHPGLRYALSQEFQRRADGWPGLLATYGWQPSSRAVTGLDHGLAYEAIVRGHVDVIDVYATDPQLVAHGLTLLEDDRHHFPAYDAVLLYRLDLPQRAPRVWAAWSRLEGALDAARMRALNAEVELGRQPYSQVAAAFVAGKGAESLTPPTFTERLLGSDFLRLTLEHVGLVVVSLAVSIAVGVPLGWLAHRRPRWRYPLLAATGVLQTIPSLALLALLIVVLDRIGTVPALVALALYALLPIVRNTQTGLDGIPHGLREAGVALGLTAGDRWRHIELPLAAPAVLAGIRTAAVLNVGTATIAAFVGAGGYGERIVAGLAVHDSSLLLAGALPAAVLALLLEALFQLAEGRLVRRASRAD